MFSYQQQSRINRLNDERHYLLDVYNSDTKRVYAISGSTGKVYYINLDPDGESKSYKISCDCPDMSSWALKYGCLCKHCCFFLIKVLQLANLADVIRTHKIQGELPVIEQQRLNECSDDVCRERYLIRKSSQSDDDNAFTKIYKDLREEVCPICFEQLIITDQCEPLLSCPSCCNSIHSECMKRWLKTHKTCVFCRSIEWENYVQHDINVYH